MVRFGVVTDAHYADREPANGRYYREALDKMREAMEALAPLRPGFVVELGDLIDSAPDLPTEIEWLRRIDRELARFDGERHYVVGNHCVKSLTREELIANTGARDPLHYTFERGGIRFVVLDACYRSDGVPYGRDNAEWTDSAIPSEQVDWLGRTLGESDTRTIVFVHQRLDATGDYAVGNAAEVRSVLEASGVVLAVFQGHEHRNDLREIGGIRYVTFRGMIEGSGPAANGYALVEVTPDGAVSVRGFRDQASYAW